MKPNKQNPDFLHIGRSILKWYHENGRDLPFRKTKNPYKIWICEIVFQQTRIEQGLGHYQRFIVRFPNVETLANAETDEVLLYWKGLGYYSRAINIHKAAQQVMTDFGGVFPHRYQDILTLKGVGKYTAAAISSICFNEQLPAIDGNFYRVLSRVFADDFDISSSKAFSYFSDLAFRLMPKNKAGDFNQAIMDLGSGVCKPKNPKCEMCPVQSNCLAFITNKMHEYPKKLKKVKTTDLELRYYFVGYKDQFLIRQRGSDFIWKKLYEFPAFISDDFKPFIINSKTIKHQLSHKNLKLEVIKVMLASKAKFRDFAEKNQFIMVDYKLSHQKSFPKPLENYLKNEFKTQNSQ